MTQPLHVIMLLASVCGVGTPLMLSIYYWRKALARHPVENHDLHTLRTIVGVQLFHLYGNRSWWQHVQYNEKAYTNVAVISLSISSALILVCFTTWTLQVFL